MRIAGRLAASFAAMGAAVSCAAAAPAPAAAAGAAIVAGPTESGATLVAFDRGRRVCAEVRSTWLDFSNPDCTRPSGRLRRPFIQTAFDGRGRRAWHWGMVAPEVAAVEVVMGGGLRKTVATSGGEAYKGRFAGRMRFFVVEGRGARGQEPRYVKLLAADGTVLALVEHFFSDPVRVGPAATVDRGRVSRAGWSLRAFTKRALAPLPGNEERFVDQPCIDVKPTGRRPLGEICLDPDFPRGRYAQNQDQACGAVGSVATGLVGRDARSVRAVLGDGRVARLRLHALPARYGGRRAFALVLGGDVAVRRVVLVERGGRRKTLMSDLPPGSTECGEAGGVLIAYGGEARPPRGPLRLSIYDDGVLLCATLADPRPRRDCDRPPLEDYESRILVRRAAGRTMVAGVLPADAVAAIVRLRDGSSHRVHAADAGLYRGLYAGAVRVFSLDLAGSHGVRAVHLVDAAGRRALVYSNPRLRALSPPRPLLRLGGLTMRLRLYRYEGSPRRFACLGLAGDGRERGCAVPFGGLGQLEASCTPRRTLVWGLLGRPSTQPLYVETDRGPVAARVVVIDRRLQTQGARAAFLAIVPPGAAPVALSYGPQRARVRALRAPAAADQCGYSTLISFDRPLSAR